METCASRRVVASPQAAAMRLHDGAADSQSHPGTVSFGGEERIEDLVHLLGGQPHAGIADGNQ